MSPYGALHEPECIIAKASQALRRNAYAMLWPDHCTNCDASGIFMNNVRLEVGEETAAQECAECSGVGRCPRCGVRHSQDDYSYYSLVNSGICTNCTWRWNIYTDHKPAPEWSVCRCMKQVVPEFEVQVFGTDESSEMVAEFVSDYLVHNPDFMEELIKGAAKQFMEGGESGAEKK